MMNIFKNVDRENVHIILILFTFDISNSDAENYSK